MIFCVMKLQVITWLKVTCMRQQIEHDSLAKQIQLSNINAYSKFHFQFCTRIDSSSNKLYLCKTHFDPITKTFQTVLLLPLNNEPRPYRSIYKQGFSQFEKNEVVMCLNSPTLPFLPCFIAFCSTHSYTSYFYEIFATCDIMCYELQVITWLKVTCMRQQIEHDSLAKQIQLPNINAYSIFNFALVVTNL